MKDLNLQLEAIINKHKLIEKKLSDQDTFRANEIIELNKEYSEITPIVDLINSFMHLLKLAILIFFSTKLSLLILFREIGSFLCESKYSIIILLFVLNLFIPISVS